MNFPEEIWERVRNMAVYFVMSTEQVDIMKLNKLYYFADKMAIEDLAFSISDQPYYADANGPVPVSADREKILCPHSGCAS